MRVLVIAPHPDDETLGCGGTLLRHYDESDEIFWLIITNITVKDGWSNIKVKQRETEIKDVSKKYRFKKVFNFKLPTTKIDTFPLSQLIEKITDIYNKIEPEVIYMPFVGDVHTDHQIIVKALQSTIKWFRFPFIKRVLMYETLSETEYNYIDSRSFKPNVFVDISHYLAKKIHIMKTYESEIGTFPFPRSEEAMSSLASFRGSQSGYMAAEAFELAYERR